MESGFFVMEDVQRVLDAASVTAGAELLRAKIGKFQAEHPRVNPANIAKAEAAIARARTKQQLAFTVTNFVLAHPTEGLKVLK